MVDISWGYNGDVVVFFNQQCDIWECKLTVDISWGSSWIINGSLEYWWGNHAKRGSINSWALAHWWRCHGFIHEIITSLFGWLSPLGVDNLYPVGFVPWGIPSYIPIVYGPMNPCWSQIPPTLSGDHQVLNQLRLPAVISQTITFDVETHQSSFVSNNHS
jgi:hypothetical protein